MSAHDRPRTVGADQALVVEPMRARLHELGGDALDRLVEADVGVAALAQVILDGVAAGGPSEGARQLQGMAGVVVADVDLGPRSAAVEALVGENLRGQLTSADLLAEIGVLLEDEHPLSRAGQGTRA